MKKAALCLFALLLGSCQNTDSGKTDLNVQRIFGECRANVPKFSKPLKNPDGECEIITSLLDEFERENPDINLRVNIVSWPGYDQLSAQFAAQDPPDITTMHQSAMPDYAMRGLILPIGDELAQEGIKTGDFTPAARKGVTIDGKIYGLPFDNWTQLWHINTKLFAEAGLMKNGEPILPHNKSELLEQAAQFTRITGKPYLIQATANEQASYSRNLYSYMIEKNVPLFDDAGRIKLNNPDANEIVSLFATLYQKNLMSHNQDYPAATQAFLNGEGGVYQVGTWMIGTFATEAKTEGRPLYHAYDVRPYPSLFNGNPPYYVDGHAWVLTNRKRSDKENAAAMRLMKFLYRHDFDWSRSGHLPAVAAVADSAKYLALPYRANIVKIVKDGKGLPRNIERQFAISDTIGDEMASATLGFKTPQQALQSAQTRVNALLFHVIKPKGKTKDDPK